MVLNIHRKNLKRFEHKELTTDFQGFTFDEEYKTFDLDFKTLGTHNTERNLGNYFLTTPLSLPETRIG